MLQLLDECCQVENRNAELRCDSLRTEYDFVYLPMDFRWGKTIFSSTARLFFFALQCSDTISCWSMSLCLYMLTGLSAAIRATHLWTSPQMLPHLGSANTCTTPHGRLTEPRKYVKSQAPESRWRWCYHIYYTFLLFWFCLFSLKFNTFLILCHYLFRFLEISYLFDGWNLSPSIIDPILLLQSREKKR